MSFFFFNDTATTEIYTLSLHDALPISPRWNRRQSSPLGRNHQQEAVCSARRRRLPDQRKDGSTERLRHYSRSSTSGKATSRLLPINSGLKLSWFKQHFCSRVVFAKPIAAWRFCSFFLPFRNVSAGRVFPRWASDHLLRQYRHQQRDDRPA